MQLPQNGPPVEPHDALPLRSDLPECTSAWQRPKLLRCMVEPLGLPVGITDPQVAAHKLQEAPLEYEDVEAHTLAYRFIPHEGGYDITFLDGSVSRLRFRRKTRRVRRVRLGVVGNYKVEAGSVYVTGRRCRIAKGLVRA